MHSKLILNYFPMYAKLLFQYVMYFNESFTFCNSVTRLAKFAPESFTFCGSVPVVLQIGP